MDNPLRSKRTYLTSGEACSLLGVKPATLYAYTSRGQIHAVPGRGPKASLYLAEDVYRLRERSRARSSQGPIAGAALNFGEPVLETALVRFAQDTLYYRGLDVAALCRDGVLFENVAELLWTGAHIDSPVFWRFTDRALWSALLRSRQPRDPPLIRLRRAVSAAACNDKRQKSAPPEQELASARQLMLALVGLLDVDLSQNPHSGRDKPVAHRLTQVLGVGEEFQDLLNTVLIVVAEHELNASSFAARVASSTRASVYSCLEAALAAYSGPRHGGYSLLVEGQIAILRSAHAARRWVREQLAAGHPVHGFGQPLYPDGDPRARILLAAAQALWQGNAELSRIDAVADEVYRVAGHRPNVDFALAALGRLLKLEPGMIGAVFALGRCAGWTAHILEQRNSPALIRPRAKYVGV